MEMNLDAATLNRWYLKRHFSQTFKNNLSDAARRPNYGIELLGFVADVSLAVDYRETAALILEGHLEEPPPDNPMSDAEKEEIKALILPLMLSAPRVIQAHLCSAVSVLANPGFPNSWPGLLPALRSGLQAALDGNAVLSVHSILSLVKSLFKKFRCHYNTDDPIMLDLSFCLEYFDAPFLSTVVETLFSITTAANAKIALYCYESCCSIFRSLYFLKFPEDNPDEWINRFLKLLTAFDDLFPDPDDHHCLFLGLRSEVCATIIHYVEKDEDLLQNYLIPFMDALSSLLLTSSSYDIWGSFNYTAINFFTILSTSVHHALLFQGEIFERITQVLPILLTFTPSDSDDPYMVAEEWTDFREGGLPADQLLYGLAVNYKHTLTQLLSAQINKWLASYALNPDDNWTYKTSAILLLVRFATPGALVYTDLVDDVHSFFTSHIVPELQDPDVDARPFLKATALVFFTTFRVSITKPVAIASLYYLIQFLTSRSYQVLCSAATCIEKLLLVKDNGVQPRYTSSDIAPFLESFFQCSSYALVNPPNPETDEDKYVMRCIMQVLLFAVADISPDLAEPWIVTLTTVLRQVSSKPEPGPVFIHCLCEALATLVRSACEKDPSRITKINISLFPCLKSILATKVMKLFPYACQLVAQLVDFNGSPVPPEYMKLFDTLLSSVLWNKSAYVPALVCFLQSFLQQAPNEPTSPMRLPKVFVTVKKLIDDPSTLEQAVHVLNLIIENLGYDVMQEHMIPIWPYLFQKSKTPTLGRCLIIHMSLFLVKHGVNNLIDSVNSVREDEFRVILAELWIPNLKTITGHTEVKLSAVASTKLLCQLPLQVDPAAEELWGMLLDSIAILLTQHEDESVEDEPEVPDFGEATGYQATFVRLHNAAKKKEEPLKNVEDPKSFLVTSLADLCAQGSENFAPVIAKYVRPVNRAALLQLCLSYNCDTALTQLFKS